MTGEAYTFVIVLAVVVAAIGQAVGGFSFGGCLVSIALAFVGALVGNWAQSEFRLQEPIPYDIGGATFPVVWMVIGAGIFVAMANLIGGRRR